MKSQICLFIFLDVCHATSLKNIAPIRAGRTLNWLWTTANKFRLRFCCKDLHAALPPAGMSKTLRNCLSFPESPSTQLAPWLVFSILPAMFRHSQLTCHLCVFDKPLELRSLAIFFSKCRSTPTLEIKSRRRRYKQRCKSLHKHKL